MNNLKAKIQNLPKIKGLFLCALLVVVVWNFAGLTKEIISTRKKRTVLPYFFFGLKFSGLGEIFKDVDRVGYYTDKSLDKKRPAAHFAQAQYTLIPVVLDLDYQRHEYVLFDCSSEEVARKKIKELGMIPLKKNEFGIILARNLRPKK